VTSNSDMLHVGAEPTTKPAPPGDQLLLGHQPGGEACVMAQLNRAQGGIDSVARTRWRNIGTEACSQFAPGSVANRLRLK
jgi:hypothetical protein